MLPILNNDAMREADRHTIEDLGVPGIVLMENAATGVVDALRDEFPDARRVLILCGQGNNGGDGFAAARHLHNGGLDVQLCLLGSPDRLTGDAAANHRLARAFDVAIAVVENDDLSIIEALLDDWPADLVVDALLGTGTDRQLTGRYAALVDTVAATGIPVVAVDVPTGLNGSSSEIPGPHLPAELTVTFAALKPCHVLPPACICCGEVAVVDIGIPPDTLDDECSLWLTEAEDIALMLPTRSPNAHKGQFGHTLIVAGAQGRGGAVAIAAQSAVVVGSGLVTMAVPEPVVPVVDAACLEAMTHPVSADGSGAFVGGDGGIGAILDRMTAIAIGPGMGVGEGAKKMLSWVLETWGGPLLLDADAINLVAGAPERLAGRERPPVLTPHPGELGRLLGVATEEVVADRVAAARQAARRSGSIVVAKGYGTVIADPDGQTWVNPTGDVGLASGGSGDALTGAIAGLLAQGVDPLRAAQVGCWLHGRAGEIGGEIFPAAVPASELPNLMADAWGELEDRTAE
jgi:NAD(P)H-hydrate epimerase